MSKTGISKNTENCTLVTVLANCKSAKKHQKHPEPIQFGGNSSMAVQSGHRIVKLRMEISSPPESDVLDFKQFYQQDFAYDWSAGRQGCEDRTERQ